MCVSMFDGQDTLKSLIFLLSMSRQSRKRPSKAHKRLYQRGCSIFEDNTLLKGFANALLYSVKKDLEDAKHGMHRGKPLPPLSEDDHLFH